MLECVFVISVDLCYGVWLLLTTCDLYVAVGTSCASVNCGFWCRTRRACSVFDAVDDVASFNNVIIFTFLPAIRLYFKGGSSHRLWRTRSPSNLLACLRN